MALFNTILRKVKSFESLQCNNDDRSLTSPPPEFDTLVFTKKKKTVTKYSGVSSKVDARPPQYDPKRNITTLEGYSNDFRRLYHDNLDILMAIRRMDLIGGLVDSHWMKKPLEVRRYYDSRKNFLKRILFENKLLYKRLVGTGPKVETAKSHRRQWIRNRKKIVDGALGRFILFPPVPTEDIEDSAFLPPEGVKRPRVFLELRVQNCAGIGSLEIELFTDVCPNTCGLFLDLIRGDGVGFGYVGTQFFRKVPHLYWRGGDVVYNNGFGCYAQRGRSVPIGAENYHFSHSMPGLLSMPVTCDDEMCGLFNITFKPLTQFDLRNVVFGRVVRPSATFQAIQCMGSALSTQPAVQVCGTRHRRGDRWERGAPNTRLMSPTPTRFAH